MNADLTIVYPIQFQRGRFGRKRLTSQRPPPAASPCTGNVPRLARLLALAHRLEGLVRTGQVRDFAELARLGRISRGRLTQFLNLLSLAPDIQEEILFLPPTRKGRDPLTERDLRGIVSTLNWSEQRRLWSAWKRP